MADKKKKRTRRSTKARLDESEASKKDASTIKEKLADPNALQRANAMLRSEGYLSGTGIDSIERRIPYDQLLNHDVVSEEYGRIVNQHGAEYFRLLRRLSTNDKMHHNIIAQCEVAYINYGVVKNVVDLYADFASEGLDIVHDNAAVHNFYRVWMKKVNLKERVNRFLTDYFMSGQSFVYKIRAKIETAEERDMKRGKAGVEVLDDNTILIRGEGKLKDRFVSPKIVLDNELMHLSSLKDAAVEQAKKGKVTMIVTGRPSISKSQEAVEQRMIPWEYISLSPLQMETRGRDVANKGNWVFVLNKADALLMTQFMSFVYNKKLKQTEISIPDHLKGKIKDYTGHNPGLYTTEIVMSPDDLSVVHDKKFDTWAWAIPFVYPALKHLNFKDCLRSMEKRYCYSVINSVTLWSLGDPANGIYPEDEHFERLAEILQQPGQAMNIIWPNPITASVIEPKMTNALDPKKHESVDKDILNALGIPDVLIGGKGSNFSNSAISVAATLKKLEVARNKFESWLLSELKEIADAMGFRKLPTIRWKRSSLRDQKAQQNFKLQLFDRGILSAEALLIEADEDFEVEAKRQRREKTVADETGVGVMDKRGPYFRPEELAKLGIFPYGWNGDRNMEEIKREDMEFEVEKQQKMNSLKEEQRQKDSETEQNPKGRPPGKEDTKERKERQPEQKSVDAMEHIRFHSLKEKCVQLLNDIEENIRSRSKSKRGSVSEKRVFSIASQIGPQYTQKMIADMVTATTKGGYAVREDMASTFEKTHTHFKLQSFANKTTKAERYMLFACTWASYHMN